MGWESEADTRYCALAGSVWNCEQERAVPFGDQCIPGVPCRCGRVVVPTTARKACSYETRRWDSGTLNDCLPCLGVGVPTAVLLRMTLAWLSLTSDSA